MEKKVIKLAIDLALGKVQKFSYEESNDTLRRAFQDLFELQNDRGGIDRRVFREKKAQIFTILEEILNETIHEGLREQFSDFAEYRNLAWGDQNLFRVPDNSLFRIALVSDGNGNLRRQRMKDGEEFVVTTETYGAKVGEEFHRFLTGSVDWTSFIDNIAESFRVDLQNRIYNAIYDSFGKYGATYHKTLTGEVKEDDIVEMAMHIEARTGEKVNIYGTKLALRKLVPSVTTDNMNDNRNKVGYYGEIAGITVKEIPQSHKHGKDEFVIDNDFILLLPESKDKMVKIVNEGDSIIQEQAGGMTADMMQEYFIANKFGVAIVPSMVYGFIKLS